MIRQYQIFETKIESQIEKQNKNKIKNFQDTYSYEHEIQKPEDNQTKLEKRLDNIKYESFEISRIRKKCK